jgi:hypothetical protein
MVAASASALVVGPGAAISSMAFLGGSCRSMLSSHFLATKAILARFFEVVMIPFANKVPFPPILLAGSM